MSAARTLRNKIGFGRPEKPRRKKGVPFNRISNVERVEQITCVGPHVNGVPALKVTHHETWMHPTRGERWVRVG